MKLKGSLLEPVVLLLLICSLNAAVINLQQGDACAKVCSGKENIFKYQENKIYVYNFLSRHSIKNPNSKEETLQLELQGKAQVSKISACDFGLLLTEVKLKESLKEKSTMSKEYEMMKTLLEKYPLRFGFDDGRVTGVCQDNMDNDFAVNVKRGILSSLQVSLDSLDTPSYLTETDIAGDCITEYTTREEPPNFVIITKKKSISGCSKKTKYFTTLSGRVHEQPKESRNLALLDGTYGCEIKVKRSEGLKESICQESHIFKPFKSESEGSQIVINQELKFDSIKNGKINAKVPTTRSDLTMNHGDKKPLFMKSKLKDPKVIVQEVCRTMKDSTTSVKVTELFLNLIRSLTGTSYEDIKSLEDYIVKDASCNVNKIKIRNLFLDSLSNVKTDAAFKFLIEDAKIYKLSKLGFSIFDNPTSTMIATLAKKLEENNSYNSVSTILSSMIKSFCENTPGCMLNPDIIIAMDAMTKPLGSNCYETNKKIRSKIQYTLRAIGNVGSTPNFNNLITTLKACVFKKSNDDEIKIYATQAVRQFPCNEDVDKFLWTIFDDVSFNSEIRIEAYLSLTRCPTRGIFGEIIQKLNNEQSQQLGSFVWSHISNLMETADRYKTGIRDMLQVFTTPMSELEKKFNLDFRSYSKNIEKTYQKDYTSANIDTNMIFSSSSPIPSSISINTTFELFGRSINLFEMGVRGKGIHEKIFSGVLKPKAHDNPHHDVVKMHQKISRNADKLSVSLYSKIMGREVYFSPNIISDITMTIMDISSKPSFERSLLLIDSIVSIASISGFPVELQIESAASVNFNIERNTGMSATDIELSTKSNYGVQITGKLLVNAHCTKVGVQSKGSISKDLEFGGKLKLKQSINDDKTIDLSDYQFELNKIPDNSKLFSISNEVTLIHKLEKVETIEKYDVKLEKCTGEGMMTIMGLKVCVNYKEAPKLSAYFPNIKAEIAIAKFDGFKIQWKKESSLKPIRKLKSLLLSTTFPGADEDSFRLKVDRNPKLKIQSYELLLWKKLSYMKFEINDKKITGELKTGKTEATLSGIFGNKGIFVSEMNVDIKSDKDTGKLYFYQKFTKDGPEVTLKLTKNGDNGFDLLSKTTLRLTSHKVFNFFQRFRHSINLKYSGDNEMSLLVETSQANRPPSEYKSKVEIFWKTKSKRNFYVNQIYRWQKYPETDNSDLFGKVSGYKYALNLDHELEVKEKKFNITNNFVYFISKDFQILGKNPSLFMIQFKREDGVKKETVFEASSRFGHDLSNIKDGKFLWENVLNYPAVSINRKLNSKITWKLNKLEMYDIYAEVSESQSFQFLFQHMFTSTQNGITSAEVKVGDVSYKISSELKLPKGHLLKIVWPKNNIEIDSAIDVKTLIPFNLIVNHNLKVNTVLIAKIINSAQYNNDIKELIFNSVSTTGKGNEIINIDFKRKLNYEISSKRIFYDYVSTMKLKIPDWKIDKVLNIEQFADIDIEGTINIKSKTFTNKVILENMLTSVPKLKYGYEISVQKQRDSVSYIDAKSVIYSGNSEDKVVLKWGKEGYNVLLGITIDLNKTPLAELMYKLNVKDKTATSAMSMLLNIKESPEYNFFMKRNLIANWNIGQFYSLKWNGEYGKEKTKGKVNPFSGFLTLNHMESKSVNIAFNMEPFLPYTSMSLANVNYVFSYNFENKVSGNYITTLNSAVRWQKEGVRTANYYDLQINTNVDKKLSKIDSNLILTKDSSQNEIISIKALLDKGENVEISFKFIKHNAKLTFNVIRNDFTNLETKLILTTSNQVLKELTIGLENKRNGKTLSMVSNMKLNSEDKIYELKLSRIMKKDFLNKIDIVEQLKWESNIPYIQSGSSVIGLLSLNKDFQFNLNLIQQNLKIIDIKIVTSDITKNLQLMIASNAKKNFKLTSNFNRDDTKLTYELDSIYDTQYFKISKMEFTYKKQDKTFSSSANIVVKTSMENVKEIILLGNINFDNDNILRTYKENVELKLNGKLIEFFNADLEKGIINMKTLSGQYIKGLNFESYEVKSKFKIESIRNFMIEFNSYLNDKSLTDLKFGYFRMKENELPKKIETLGEALFYLNVEYKRQNCNGKMLMFFNKDKKNGVVKMQMDIPLIGMKFDEVSMVFENIQGASNLYSGTVKYKDDKYSFSYERSDGYKRKFKMTASSKASKLQEVIFAFDFTKNYVLKLSFDDYFDFDVSLTSLTLNAYSGLIKFIYKREEKLNLKTSFKVIIPKDTAMYSDFFKLLFGIKQGMDLNFEINGNILKTAIKTNIQISHLESKLFPGGTKSHNFYYFEIKDSSLRKYTIRKIFDRNFPKFHIEDDLIFQVNDVVNYKHETKLSYISLKNIFFESKVLTKYIDSKTLVINNDNVVQATFSYLKNSIKSGFGFQHIKQTCEASVHYVDNLYNSTFETNIGYIFKAASNSKTLEIYPVGKEYFIRAKGVKNSFKISLNRKKEKTFVMQGNVKNIQNEIKVTIKAYDERKEKETLGIEIKGESTYEGYKYFASKSSIKYSSKLYQMILNSNLNVDKRNVADLTLKYETKKGISPYKVDVKYKGSYIISAKAMLNTKNSIFTHTIEVKDGNFKTDLWSSSSNCEISNNFDCYYNHVNKARDMKAGFTWTKNLNILELTWNKRKGQGILFSCERLGKITSVTLSSPLRTVKITRIINDQRSYRKRQLTVEVTRKADPTKPMSLSLEYIMNGSLKTDYSLDLKLNTNLMQKGLQLSINRQVSMNIGDIYVLSIKSTFDGEKIPFFTLEGYLRQLSARSYEMKIHAKNKDSFIKLETAASFTYEEISFEYKLLQSNKKDREFVFKFLPFKKLLITNKNDFEILFSRTIYQYGYRRDVVVKIGKNGPNIVAYETLIKSPFRYYAEVLGNEKKFVVHFRPVGNMIIGEVYRKIEGSRKMDMSMKLGIDSKNILNTKIYWNPKLVDIIKVFLNNILKPENLKTLIVDAYDSSENQISEFTSNIKMDLVKSMNIQGGLDFMKGIASDIENIPNAFAQSYDDDNLFMKSILDKINKCLKSIEFSETFSRSQNNMKRATSAFSSQLYEWFINLKLYSSIYDAINSNLISISYDDIKSVIEGIVKCGGIIRKSLNSQIESIGKILDSLSRQAEAASNLAKNFKENVIIVFKGSSLNQMIQLLGEIKDEIINGLGQVVETGFIKQQIVYYKETIENMKDLIKILREMRMQLMKYVTSTNLVNNIVETINLIRSMKYKEAFINMIKPEEAKFNMDLNKATMDISFYVPPIIRPAIQMYKTLSDWFPAQILSQMRGSGLSGKLLSVFYRYEYLVFNYGSLKSLKNLLPPFKKTAWVFGGNSILTYDGSSIRVGSGKCTYLLARDIKAGSFSLVMNIMPKSKNKEFELSYINKITLISSGEVKIDGVLIKTLPQLISSKGKTLEIYRDYDMTRVKTSEGLTVEYFSNQDILKVTLTGYWHGSVKGLLGSNDFDVINDWSTPDGRITHDTGILSKSWSIGSCRSKINEVKINNKQLQGCVNLFKPDSLSYLERCYSLINPEPYFELCRLSIQYQELSKENYEKLICDLSRNYVVRCKSKGMMIRLKKSCISCGAMKLTSLEKEINLKKNPKLNYIFIVEQSVCLLPYKSLIENLVDIMALEKDNIYTLMSFNGRDIFQPSHFKSLDNEITTKSKGFKVLLNELIKPSQISGMPTFNSSTEGGQAIYKAIKMPSKQGYIEKIVFFSCSACGENKKFAFSTLAGLLRSSGISFTYFTTQSFTGPKATTETTGFGNKMVYFFEQDSLKVRVLEKNVQPPNDMCSSLASINQGFVWSLNTMKSKMRVRRVAETIHSELKQVKGNPKQKCYCETGNYEEGKIECKIRGLY